jgi:hypothetical protein
MTIPGQKGLSGTRSTATLVVCLAALVAFLIPVFFGSPAGASTAQSAATTCTSYPSSACTTTTVAGATTTTVAGATTTAPTCPPASGPTLVASYADNVVSWSVSGLPTSAVGTTIHLYLNGQIQGPGGTAVVAGTCTATAQDPVCLSAGNYTAAASIPGVATPTTTLAVSSSGCLSSAGSGTPGSGSSSSGGSLAFTGADILLLLAIAAILLFAGFVSVRLARQRRQG